MQTGEFLCSECGKGFKSACELKSHEKRHTEKTVKCPDCPMLFHNQTKMNNHREIHLDKKFKCNLCSSVFRTRTAMGTHISKQIFSLKFHHSMRSIKLNYFS